MTSLMKKFPLLSSNRILRRTSLCEAMLFIFTILLAGFLGNYIALLATRQMTNTLARFIIGIVIGLLVGIGVGILINRTWKKIQLYFAKAQSQ